MAEQPLILPRRSRKRRYSAVLLNLRKEEEKIEIEIIEERPIKHRKRCRAE